MLAPPYFAFLLDHCENVVLAHDEMLVLADADLVAGVLPEQNDVALLYFHRHPVALLVNLARAGGDHLTLLGLLLGGIGNNDSTLLDFLFDALDQDSVL